MNAAIAAMVFAGPLLFGQTLAGQDPSPKRRYFQAHTVPAGIRQIALALGPRVQTPGRERMIVTGTLARSGSTSALRIIRELPGLARIEESGANGKILVFDFQRLTGRSPIDDSDEDLVESLEMDSTEQFLNSIAPGATVRLIGQRFQVRGEAGFGAQVDVLEMVLPMKSRRDREVRVKHFMFDTRTGLLRRVAYNTRKANQLVRIQTVVSDYTQIDGHPIPGKIARIVNGIAAFSFTTESAVILPAVDDNAFRAP